jgi:ribosome-binding factor A
MEQRGVKYHRARVGEAVKEEIAIMIEGELGDPRIGLASVTEVQLAPDGRSARVFVSVEGSEEEAEQTIEGLNAAKGYVRRELTERLQLRQAPELFFQLDRSDQAGGRVEELLKRIEQRKK